MALIMDKVRGSVILAGAATGPILVLSKPISLWGGVEPSTGRIIDPRHPDHGTDISGSILVLAATIGSSSSSAIMLELLRQQHAPAALLLGRVDAILTLGIIVAREMGHPAIPVIALGAGELAKMPAEGWATVMEDGGVEVDVSRES